VFKAAPIPGIFLLFIFDYSKKKKKKRKISETKMENLEVLLTRVVSDAALEPFVMEHEEELYILW